MHEWKEYHVVMSVLVVVLYGGMGAYIQDALECPISSNFVCFWLSLVFLPL